MMIDTDVFIWYMRGNPKAQETLKKEREISVSVVTYIELIQGMRNKQELQELRRTFRAWDIKLIYISEEISSKAVFFIERHFLSHSPTLADAMICATAIVHGSILMTANDRHYKMIKELRLKIFRP